MNCVASSLPGKKEKKRKDGASASMVWELSNGTWKACPAGKSVSTWAISREFVNGQVAVRVQAGDRGPPREPCPGLNILDVLQ